MTAPAPTDTAAIFAELRAFQSGFTSLLLATVSPAGEPDASYAAHVERDGALYIYVSDLAVHTRNLLATGRVSVLFIEDEGLAGSPFTRRRLTLQCQAREVARDSAAYAQVLALFHKRFGALIATLAALPDFHLVCLHPVSGRWVTGFARAFVFTGEQLTHLRPDQDRADPSQP